jgi:type IV pilus assembly protein PilB
MEVIPRQNFVEHSQHNKVVGHSIPSQEQAKQLLNSIALKSTDHILQIGAGAGYLTALISTLVTHVTSLECCPTLAKIAQTRFDELRLDNIELRQCDGRIGAEDNGPYDAIFVSSPLITERDNFINQLKPNGSIVAIEGDEYGTNILVKYCCDDQGKLKRRELGPLNTNNDIGMIMLDLGMIDEATLLQAKELAHKDKVPLIEVLRKLTSIEEIDMYRSIALQCKIPYKSLDELIPIAEPVFFGEYSRGFLDCLHLIPLAKTHKSLIVATYDPEAITDDLQAMNSDLTIERILVTPTDFRRLWSMLELCLQGEMKQLKSYQKADKQADNTLLNHQKSKLEAHLISLLDALLLDAVSDRASDIHIEQYQDRVRIRLRVDGELHDISHYQLTQHEARGLINVIKIRSDLNIAEKRLPQGGRSQMQVGNLNYDLRIQIQPSLYGEDVVIRLLPQNNTLISIDELGLSPFISKSYQRLLNNPTGLILVVGPTGSGKSTTLYAGLQLLAQDGRRKVITIEDPVEYSIDNIQQTQIRSEINFNFSDAMRSFVRQDPDVILVGEIRDEETAMEAIRASQTGHVVLSTLHCNDATDALQRLYDLNVHPNSIASELLAVIAQRLAKRICTHCRTQVEPDTAILAELFPDGAPSDFKCYAGQGCLHCDDRGTKGRIGIMEFMQVNTDIRNAISRQPPILELRETALNTGLITMRSSALDHVMKGIIPLTELPRLLPEERMAPEKRMRIKSSV